ncbi:type VII secretion protein EccB [Bifidobacterium stellenboschense]|uniref:Serine protease n=1 Tax=Bifidobacterium stellenboschense TaxID=762211 RepID=A0A087DKS9_9BIFI|nr:type VII secretion protein EccB [Bifidobacterium stellenboschense]KFI96129.1 serine protease [Bifidobacterium stellenboschense]
MANKKDLQDAQNYSRARLVTAFTSGMPDGKELTPKKGLMPVAVGVGLTAIMVLVSVFYGIISPGLPSDWSNNKLIIGKDTASRFVSVNGVLHPVINTASARLLIPSSEYKVITVDDDELEGIPVGSSVGIVGAPDILPNRSRLASRHLVSCLDAEHADTDNLITDDALVTPVDATQAMVVNVDGTGYLLADGTRHRLPREGLIRDATLRILGVGQLTLDGAPKASAQWLDLFAGGSDIGPISVPGSGTTIEVGGDSYTVGSLVADPSSESTMYVILKDGTLAPLTGAALEMYKLSLPASRKTLSMTAQEQSRAGFRNATSSVVPDDWPKRRLTAMASGDAPCVALDTRLKNGETGRKDASVGVSMVTFRDPRNRPKHSDSGTTVQNATGALFRTVSTSEAKQGTLYVVDGTGVAYPVPDDDEETLKRLGYQAGDITPIPRAWINVFHVGVALSSKNAGLQVTAQDTRRQTQDATNPDGDSSDGDSSGADGK